MHVGKFRIGILYRNYDLHSSYIYSIRCTVYTKLSVYYVKDIDKVHTPKLRLTFQCQPKKSKYFLLLETTQIY